MKGFFDRLDALSGWHVVLIMAVIALIAVLLEIALAGKRRSAGIEIDLSNEDSIDTPAKAQPMASAISGDLRERRLAILLPHYGDPSEPPLPAALDRDRRRKMGEDIPPAPGDRRYSNRFGSYVQLVSFQSDNDYYFRVLSGPHAGLTAKNQSPWSRLTL